MPDLSLLDTPIIQTKKHGKVIFILFFQPTSTHLFQWLKTLPLGTNIYNQYLRRTHSSIGKGFKPYVVNLKPFYCETILYNRYRYRDSNGNIKPSFIMQLCNLTYELATLGQEKSRRSRYLTQINFQLFKNTASQINAICDLQEDKVSLDEAVVEIQDTNGDKIAIAKFVLELKE